MNVYRCISEEYGEVVPIMDDGSGPMEYGCAAELVVARTRGKAKYAAARTLGAVDMRDMLKWSVVITRKNVALPAGIISSEAKPSWWSTPAEIRKAWAARNA